MPSAIPSFLDLAAVDMLQWWHHWQLSFQSVAGLCFCGLPLDTAGALQSSSQGPVLQCLQG